MQSCVTLLLGNLFYYFLYKGNFEFFEKFKAQKEPWPWKENPQAWDKLFRRSLKFTLFNLIVMPMILNVPIILVNIPINNPIDYNFPTKLQLCSQILFCMLIEDLSFYFSHSLLHTPYFYATVHKYHHEHKTTTSFAIIHAHPLEFILVNLLPTTMCVLLLGKRMHFSSFMACGLAMTLHSLEVHSGYNFPWSVWRLLPFGNDGEEHSYHHSENLGSYGSFLAVWDTVFGSNVSFWS